MDCTALSARLADSACGCEDRARAAAQLGQIASVEAAEALTAALGDPIAAIRVAAAAALGSMGAAAVEATDRLVEASRDPDRAVRAAAADALAEVSPDAGLPAHLVRDPHADGMLPFGAAFEASSAPAALVDARGSEVHANAACRALSGDLGAACSATPQTPLLSPDIRDALPEWDMLLAGDAPAAKAELRLRAPNGSYAWVLLDAALVAEPAVDVPCVSVALQDITAIKRSQALHEVMYEISETAHASGELADVVRAAYGALTKVVPAAGLAVFLLDDSATPESPSGSWLSSDEGYEARPVETLDADCRRAIDASAARYVTAANAGGGPGGWLDVPLRADGASLGLLRLEDSERAT